jgi:hypothetical protein
MCACERGQEVWMKIRPDRHHLTWNGESVSITPSVGNGRLRCRAHYWMHRSQVVSVPEPTAEDDAGGQNRV